MNSSETDRLVTDNIGYAVALAKQYAGRGVDLDDLTSEALMAMVECAPKYDASRGVPFVGFARPYMQRAIEKAIPTPGPCRREGGAEVAADRDFTSQPTAAVETTEDLTQLERRLGRLNDRERSVITLLYGLGSEDRHTMAEAGAKLGLKRERVRQERDKALRKLKK